MSNTLLNRATQLPLTNIDDVVNLQATLDLADAEMRYNAIYTFDATVQSAPPNLPRSHNWHIDMWDELTDEHQYDRYFYLTSADAQQDTPSSPNLLQAVARWRIDGKHVYFEYLSSGTVTETVNITDTDGSVLLESYRPISTEETWYFGSNQADPFPETDNIRSVIDINVTGLNAMIGNTFDLSTVDKTLVGAINEGLEFQGVHNNLTGRSNPGAHPMEAISNLNSTVSRIDADIASTLATSNVYTDNKVAAESTARQTAIDAVNVTVSALESSKASKVVGSVTGQIAVLTATGDIAAGGATSQFATAAQGAKADTALQASNIVNNLNSTIAGSVLDATQGKVLNDKINSISVGVNLGSFPSYAEFVANVDTPHLNDFCYVTFIDTDTIPADWATTYGVAVDQTWRLDYIGSTPAWTPSVKMSQAARDFTVDKIKTNEITDKSITALKIADNVIGDAQVQAGLFAHQFEWESGDKTAADIISDSKSAVLSGLESMSIDETFDAVMIPQIHFDIYDTASSLWAYLLGEDDGANVTLKLYNVDGTVMETFYNNEWLVNSYDFDTEWNEIIITIDSLNSSVVDPLDANWNLIRFVGGTIPKQDLEDAFAFTLGSLKNKLELEQGTEMAGSIMMVDDDGFVVPMDSSNVVPADATETKKGIATLGATGGAAKDELTVHRAGAETITGTKTFSVSPIVPVPTLAGHAVNKDYLDGIVGGINAILIRINGEDM